MQFLGFFVLGVIVVTTAVRFCTDQAGFGAQKGLVLVPASQVSPHVSLHCVAPSNLLAARPEPVIHGIAT
jgi:hypothetical protein